MWVWFRCSQSRGEQAVRFWSTGTGPFTRLCEPRADRSVRFRLGQPRTRRWALRCLCVASRTCGRSHTGGRRRRRARWSARGAVDRMRATRKVSAMTSAPSSGRATRRSTYPTIAFWQAAYSASKRARSDSPRGLGSGSMLTSCPPAANHFTSTVARRNPHRRRGPRPARTPSSQLSIPDRPVRLDVPGSGGYPGQLHGRLSSSLSTRRGERRRSVRSRSYRHESGPKPDYWRRCESRRAWRWRVASSHSRTAWACEALRSSW